MTLSLPELLTHNAPAVEHAALLMAKELQPGRLVEERAWLRELDALAEPLRTELPSTPTPEEQARLLAGHVYGELGFDGDRNNYDDPRNNYLNHVIERRMGIPISLAIVLVAIGRRTSISVEPIGFPGHFLARIGGPEGVYVDPFSSARVLSEADLQSLSHRVFGDSSPLDRHWLEPITTRAVVMRLLTNLRLSFAKQGEHARAMMAADQLVTMTGSPDVRRDRGLHALASGSYATAVEDLHAYLDARPDARDAKNIRNSLERARARCQQNLQ